MSMWTEIEFIDESVPTPSSDVAAEALGQAVIATFENIWCEHAEEHPASIAEDGGEFTVTRTDSGGIRIALEGNTKYEISGDVNAVEAISRAWPNATITILREWTGEGGPSVERFEFFNGERIREQQSQLVDVQPPSADDIAVDTSASAGPTVLVDMLAKREVIAHLELTPEQARQLSADLLRNANGAEFRAANPIRP